MSQRYTFVLLATVETTIEVDANIYDEALDAAWERVPTSLCASCSVPPTGPVMELNDNWTELAVFDETGNDLLSPAEPDEED